MGGMDWTNLAQDRDRWPALANAVMNPREFKYLRTCQFLRKDSVPWT